MACPNLVSDFSTPELKWYQTDLKVIIHIQITDVRDYYLLVQPDHLIFSATSNNEKYYLILYLYGGVIPEKTVQNCGRTIKVCLTKTLKWYSWLRLTMSKEKSPLISYDYESLDADQPRKKYIASVREVIERENDQNHQYILPYDVSSEEESDDDEFLYDKYS